MITQGRLKELFDYHPDGYLMWRTSGKGRRPGGMAGSITTGRQYISIGIDRKHYYAHRLIFMWHHGYLPEMVDHADMDPSNNRIENLRAAERWQNLSHAGKKRQGTSRFKGVHRCGGPRSKWKATIRANGKRYWLGAYVTEEEAARAYNEAALRLHGEFAHINQLN